MIQERVGLLLHALIQKGEVLDENAKIIEDSIQKSIDYISLVVSMEISRLIAKTYLNGEEYRRIIEEMDKKRAISHDNVLTSFQIINRLCEKSEIPYFFNSPQDYVATGEFAIKIVQDLFMVGNVRPIQTNLKDRGARMSLMTGNG